jgi:hypothetical protein
LRFWPSLLGSPLVGGSITEQKVNHVHIAVIRQGLNWFGPVISSANAAGTISRRNDRLSREAEDSTRPEAVIPESNDTGQETATCYYISALHNRKYAFA